MHKLSNHKSYTVNGEITVMWRQKLMCIRTIHGAITNRGYLTMHCGIILLHFHVTTERFVRN